MTARKARCPYCGRKVAVTKAGKVRVHNAPQRGGGTTGRRCGGSGQPGGVA